MAIHHTIIKALTAAGLVLAVDSPTEGMVTITMEGVEIQAGPVGDVKDLAARARKIVEAEDFDLDALREEQDENGDADDADAETAAEGTDEAEEEDKGTGSVVKAKYREKYKEINANDSNGDQIALALRAAITVTGDKAADARMSTQALQAIADQNGGLTLRGVNPGHVRMNLGNVLRGMLKRGIAIHIQDLTIEPTEEAKKARAEQFAKDKAKAEAKAAPKPTKEEVAAKRNAAAKARRAQAKADKAANEPQAEAQQPTDQGASEGEAEQAAA